MKVVFCVPGTSDTPSRPRVSERGAQGRSGGGPEGAHRGVRVEERPVTLGDGDAHALEEVALPAVGGPAALAHRLLLLCGLGDQELSLLRRGRAL